MVPAFRRERNERKCRARQQAYVQDVRNGMSVMRIQLHVKRHRRHRPAPPRSSRSAEALPKNNPIVTLIADFVRSVVVGALLPFITTVTTIVRTRGLIPYFHNCRTPTQLLLQTMLPTPRKRCSAYLGLLTAAAILVQQHRHVEALPGKTLTSSTMNQRLAGMEYAVVSLPGG